MLKICLSIFKNRAKILIYHYKKTAIVLFGWPFLNIL